MAVTEAPPEAFRIFWFVDSQLLPASAQASSEANPGTDSMLAALAGPLPCVRIKVIIKDHMSDFLCYGYESNQNFVFLAGPFSEGLLLT